MLRVLRLLRWAEGQLCDKLSCEMACSLLSLAHVYGALDKRLRVSANAMTQCKRPRPCGQAVALGYTSVRPSRLKLSRRDTGAPLGRSGPCAPLVDDATSSSQIAPVYAFLKQPPFDGEIPWNYTKFLVGRDGKVLRRYSPGSPFEQGMEDDVKRALKGEPLKARRTGF